MRIGIDLDGVVAMWTQEVKKTLNREFQYDFKIEESPTWDYIEKNVKPEHWKWLWGPGIDHFSRLQTYPGSYENVRYLAESHDVVFMTDRPRNARKITFEWIKMNFPFEIQGILIGKNKWEIECDIYIDDKTENVIDIQEHRPKSLVCLMDRPDNKSLDWPERVFDIEEFVARVIQHWAEKD